MNELTDEQRTRNWNLLWDLRRNIRYFAKRAGWFDAVHRLSCLLCFIGGSGAFAAFAGEAAGGLGMSEDACRRLTAAYRRVERTLEAPLPATLTLLMNVCENEVAQCDMEEAIPLPNHVPQWAAFIRQVWFWKWPARSREAYAEKEAQKKTPAT